MLPSRPSAVRRPARLFSAQLASRILAVVGVASLAVPHASCGGGSAASTGGGGGGASGSGGAGTSTGTATAAGSGGGAANAALPPPAEDCFDWSPDAGSCPTQPDVILFVFDKNGCPDGGNGVEPTNVDSGPTMNEAGQCCYVVEFMYCVGAGRPYLVDDRARVASAVGAANGWSDGDLPLVHDLTTAERASLAAAWTADGLLEHASVASFSRFALALLAAGAPSELVASAHGAALDEVRHAQLCFALASGYAGEPVGPGPFPAGGRLEVSASLAALAASTVREGCIGETVAAIVAAEQLARATDPAVRSALARIAADEARHAELAWRTVAWALQTGGTEVRAAVAKAFCEVSPAPFTAPELPGVDAGAWSAHGRLDAAAVATVVATTMLDVIAPCARALLDHAAPSLPHLVSPTEHASP